MDKKNISGLNKKALEIRKSIIGMLVPAESHHIGCSLSTVEILISLYFGELNIDPKKPTDPNRDIFIFSKGHAGAALYSTLAERGFFPKSILKKYDTNGGMLPEHVTKVVPGIELSTGSLGHGLPALIGFCLSFLREQKKNRGFILMSDGELNEGSTWEGIMFAGHHKLHNLVVIVDYNKMQGYGTTTEVLDLEPLNKKIETFGWNTYEIDGHDVSQLASTFNKIKQSKNKKPNWILANTIKGKGIPYFEGKFESHYKSIDQQTKDKILKELSAVV